MCGLLQAITMVQPVEFLTWWTMYHVCGESHDSHLDMVHNIPIFGHHKLHRKPFKNSLLSTVSKHQTSFDYSEFSKDRNWSMSLSRDLTKMALSCASEFSLFIQ